MEIRESAPISNISQEEAHNVSEIFGDINMNNTTLNRVVTNFTNLLKLQDDQNDIINRISAQQNSLEEHFNNKYQKIIPTCFDMKNQNLITVFRLSERHSGANNDDPFISRKAFIVKNNKFLELRLGEYGKIDNNGSYIIDYECDPQNPDIDGILFDEFNYLVNIKNL